MGLTENNMCEDRMVRKSTVNLEKWILCTCGVVLKENQD